MKISKCKTKSYLEMACLGFSQVVSGPTRFPSSTCIDHIYRNVPLNLLSTHVSTIGLFVFHLPIVSSKMHAMYLFPLHTGKLIYELISYTQNLSISVNTLLATNVK